MKTDKIGKNVGAENYKEQLTLDSYTTITVYEQNLGHLRGISKLDKARQIYQDIINKHVHIRRN